MAPVALLLLSALALAIGNVETSSYGREYSYVGGPRRRVIVKVIPVKRVPHSRKSIVHRSRHDSYDEGDALRTADSDVYHRAISGKTVGRTIFTPPYPPAVVKKTVHAPLHVEHVAHEHAPYQYDPYVAPQCSLANRPTYNATFCLEDAVYPTDTIIHELKKDPELTRRLMSDVTYQSADNLVDGLTKAEEEHYSREHYYGKPAASDEPTNVNHGVYAPTYLDEGGYICPSDIIYGRLKRAVNTFGQWKVVVNLPDDFKHDPKYKQYVQTLRLESCAYPGSACSFVDRLFPSACLQKHTFVRLVAYTYELGLHVDSFKLPSACSCHVSPKPVVY